MFTTSDKVLTAVKHPMIDIITLFTFILLKSFIKRFAVKVRMPPPIKANPKKKPTTYNFISSLMMASTNEAPPENTIWNPQVVLATIGSNFRITKAKIIVILLAIANAPPLRPPPIEPKHISIKYLP